MTDNIPLVERIARAISIPEHHTTWDLLTEAEKDLYRAQADYAIASLPTIEQIDKLREALKFYAARANWGTYRVADRSRYTRATDDRGAIARAALAASPVEEGGPE